ncbi:hypothetical protein [Vibrio tubiashii]|nr:hypothetical protein [Vibrio tubiashii]
MVSPSSRLVTLMTLAMVFISAYVILRDTSVFQDAASESDVEFYEVTFVEVFSGVKGGLYSHLQDKQSGKRINTEYYPFEDVKSPIREDIHVGVVPRSSGRLYDIVFLKVGETVVKKTAYGLADVNQQRTQNGTSYLYIIMLGVAIALGLSAYGKRKSE